MRLAVRLLLALGVTLLAIVAAAAYPYAREGTGWLDVEWRSPWFALALIPIPLLFWWMTFAQDRRRPRLRVGTVRPLLTGPRGARAYFRDVPGVLRAVALIFLVGAMCRPVSVLRDVTTEEQGIDIVLVIDLSLSMKAVLDGDVRDLPGQPRIRAGHRLTRLETAQIVVKDFIERRKTDRIGLVVFAKEAFLYAPTTLDYRLLSKMVGDIKLGSIDGRATAIGDAIATAVARLRRSDARSKVVLLLTDGDSNAGKISPEYAADLAEREGVQISTIQIGTGDEVEVQEGTDVFGQPRYVPRRFPVNPELLRRVAEETGGRAYIATDSRALANSMHDVLDRLEKTRFESVSASYEDLFPFLLFPGVGLLALEALLRTWLLRRFP